MGEAPTTARMGKRPQPPLPDRAKAARPAEEKPGRGSAAALSMGAFKARAVKNHGLVGEGFELEPIARGIKNEKGVLGASGAGKTLVGFDEEGRFGGL